MTKLDVSRLITLDCGSTGALLFDGKTVTKMSYEDFLKWVKTIPAGTQLAGEYAHFGCPRRFLSKAQPFSEEQLFQLYADILAAGAELRLLPQLCTRRVLNYAGFHKPASSKDDDRDCEAWYIWLDDHQDMWPGLMHPPTAFGISAIRQESYDYKAYCNFNMNMLRGTPNGYENEEDANYQFLLEYLEEIKGMLSKDAQNIFGLDQVYKTKEHAGSINFNQINMTQLYSILIILQDPEGKLKFREKTEDMPGWKFVKRYVIGMTPFHLRGGVVRSNIYWHGVRNWVGKKADVKGLYRGGYYDDDSRQFIKKMTPAQEQEYLKYRRIYCKAVKELFMAYKTVLRRVHNLGVHINIPAHAGV